jgi:LacI family transcriptional regulator
MLQLPQRQSLEKQTADILRAQIAEGAWNEWLPGERALSEMLQVSRHTLRAALQQLREEGQIISTRGLGNRLAVHPAKPAPKKLESLEVGLLVSGELDMLVPTQVMWIDHLRGMLAERGCRLHLFHGRKFAQRDPARSLRQLVTRNVHRCWILLLSARGVQEWFQENRIPCVVAGSLYAGVSLPFCDMDHHAVCRHAAGIFLRRGHTSLALVVQKSQRAGDIESEVGFTEGIRQSSAEVVVAYHDATAAGIALSVKRLMQRKPVPTAVLVVNVFHYLSTVSTLARLNFRVPEDVSVISRDGEPYLSYLLPTPAHYVTAPKIFAKTLLVQVLQLLEGGVVTKRAAQIMPEFYPGHSLAIRG